MSKIFLSYDHNDSTEVFALKDKLEQAGLEVFKRAVSLHAGNYSFLEMVLV